MVSVLENSSDNTTAVRLTQRQSDCIALVARGFSSKEIARELGISPSTVDNHVASAMHLFGFSSRAAIGRWYLDYRESATTAEVVGEAAAVTESSDSQSYFRVAIPTLGGIRNSLSMKERLFAIGQVMIVATMVTSAAASFVLGLIFFLKLAI
ncbi:MAG: hypothetical protein RIS94_2606 [Pseudomonadota bacterium]